MMIDVVQQQMDVTMLPLDHWKLAYEGKTDSEDSLRAAHVLSGWLPTAERYLAHLKETVEDATLLEKVHLRELELEVFKFFLLTSDGSEYA